MNTVGVKHNLIVVAPHAGRYCFDMLGWRASKTMVVEKRTVIVMFSRLRRRESHHSNLNKKKIQYLLIAYYMPVNEISVLHLYFIYSLEEVH